MKADEDTTIEKITSLVNYLMPSYGQIILYESTERTSAPYMFNIIPFPAFANNKIKVRVTKGKINGFIGKTISITYYL